MDLFDGKDLVSRDNSGPRATILFKSAKFHGEYEVLNHLGVKRPNADWLLILGENRHPLGENRRSDRAEVTGCRSLPLLRPARLSWAIMVKPGITLEQKRIVLQEDAITFLGVDVQTLARHPGHDPLDGIRRQGCRTGLTLTKGHDTVGTVVHVSHLAPTPLGETVTYRATVTAVDDRKLTFTVEAEDSRQVIGKGTHERFIIDIERFAAPSPKNNSAQS